MGYLDYAGLQYLWGKLKEKFAPKSHSHDDRYYTEAEMDGKLNSKVNNNEAGANGLFSKLGIWTATPTDDTYFIRQDTGGGNEFGRVKFSTLWNYIKGKTDGVYQPKGSYAASGHTHDDRYYTETEINTKLNGKANSSHTHTKSQIIDFPASLKNPTALTIQTNGAIAATYDGSAAKIVNVTKGNIGLGNVDNTADANKSVKYATSAGSANTATKATSAGTADVANSVDWSKVQNKPSSYPPASHTHAYLPTGGGTMNGALNFANNTWNVVGDDVQIGDRNTSGSFYIQGLNGATNIKLKKMGDTSAGSGDSATITYDGGNLVIDKTIQANLSGNASTATKAVSADKAISASSADKAAKLTTARTVSGGSDITLDFKYDGSGNSTANIGFYSCKHSVGNTNNYPFHRFAKLDANKGAWVDNSMTFLISQDYSGGGYGICRLVYRSNADSSNASVVAEWLVRKGLSVDTVQVTIKTDKTNGAYCDAFYKSSGTYMGVAIRAIASGYRSNLGRTWTLVNSYEVGGTTATDKKTSSECWKTIADAGNELHKQAYSSSAPAIDEGYVASAGTADSATTSNGVKDYNDANRTIKIGFAGAGLTSENLNYIAGYTDNGTKIKDVSKDVLKSWIGLGNYLPLIGGTMSGQITKSTGGSWIGDRDRAAIKSSYAGDSSYGAVAAMATKNGYWTMGNLGGNESLIFNYSTDAKYNAGKNETSQVYLPAQAGTIITSATIGSQSVNYANSASTANVANSVDWSKVQNKPSSYVPASHTHDDRYYTESEVNTKLANYQPKGNYAAAEHTHNYAGSGTAGGSANSAIKLDSSAGSATQPVYFSGGKPVAIGYTIAKSVPADAKFTDTDTWRGIQNNLTSDSTDQSLSAAQGKILKTLVDGKAPISHTHKKSQITDFPSSMPASDVYAWAKAATKPSYTKAEVGLGNVDNTADKDKNVKYATSAGSATTGLNGVSTCIFDLSSNNGSCVRFYNGLQICFGNSSKSSGVVFKLPFANDNYAVVVGGSDTLKNAWYVAGGRTTTGFNPNQSGFAVLFHWIAIGNWK